MNKIRIVENKLTVKENAPVSVNINMDQAEAIYKILADNFGEEHIKDMFTLGSLSLYNMLVKGGVAGIQETVNEQPDVLNKIADMFDRKYPHLKFDVDTMMDRIEVTGGDVRGQDVFTFGEELAGQKIFDYEITTRDKEGQDYRVFIVKSSSIGRNAVNPTNEATVDYDFSESELIRVLRQLKSGASTEVDMIKAFTKALGRELSDDEIRGYKIDPNRVATATMEEEKADRCLRIARREIPQSSAYRSGLIVKCRKGMIWKDKK